MKTGTGIILIIIFAHIVCHADIYIALQYNKKSENMTAKTCLLLILNIEY